MDVHQDRSAVGVSCPLEYGFGAVNIQEKTVFRLVVLGVGAQCSIAGVLERLSVQGIQRTKQCSRVDTRTPTSIQRDDCLRGESEPVRRGIGALSVDTAIADS